MKAILKPVSHPDLGDISIVDDLLAIGRNEEPFASRLGVEASSLSRRHARVFQEDGKFFIADLGSLNGTRINERELKNNIALLNNNDHITLGGAVEFRVEIRQANEPTANKSPAMRVTLVPEDPTNGLETIAIQNFPFLISRNEAGFDQYRERLSSAWRKLSRRHAVIALKGGRVNVEDLESSNGTFVSGARLDERSRPLADGDVVAFGDPTFSYRVRIESLHEPTQFAATVFGRSDQAPPSRATQQPKVEPQSRPATQPEIVEQPAAVESRGGANRTRFVSSADSFINVFCSDDEVVQGSNAGAHAATMETLQLKEPPKGLRKLGATVGQVWRALGGGTVDRRFMWGAAALLGVIVMAIAITYLVGQDRHQIKELLDEGQYSESAIAANRYLEHHPNDAEASTWGEEALTRAIVPTWMDHIDHDRYPEAARYLETQREAHPFIPRGLQMIDTLAWAGKLEAHMAERGGTSGPIVLFRDEAPIRALVDEWSSDSFRRQQIMDQIVTQIPQFEPIHARIFSSLTTLRGDNSLYVKAIDELKTSIQSALKRDERQSIDKLLSEFTSNYPRVSGIDALRDDLARYDTLKQLVQRKELLQLAELKETSKFQTPIFTDYIGTWLASALPPPDVIAKHAKAAEAWRTGNHDEAIAILQSVTDAPWGEVATRQIARYEKVGADYDALLMTKGKDEYWDRLLVVWSSLRPDEDGHLIKTLEPDFVAHKEKVLPRMDQSLARVRAYWSEYQSAGGIPGVIRVEERVSPRFSGQAKRLSSAYREISSGARTYQLLQVTPPPEWQSLQQDVVDEVQRQRRWLQDLNIVLEPVLLHAKLELLPEISEQSLWVQSTTDPKKD
ncbi:FHA domain-containing protein [Peristeroidobacter soli]|uniref:FHA domain-containing protein n=1 Tax=Peristeroidobacter soli TaxID=2497877 RepID=UPI00101CA509|nr:FHA domain-containing protein [Peristeroidobacter soli]